MPARTALFVGLAGLAATTMASASTPASASVAPSASAPSASVASAGVPSASAHSASVPPASVTYACNPAHQYPSGVQCATSNGSLVLVTNTATSVAAQQTYACNPAHQYPTGVSCQTRNGTLTLVYASSAAPLSKSGAASPATTTMVTAGMPGTAPSGAVATGATPSPSGTVAKGEAHPVRPALVLLAVGAGAVALL